MKLVIALLLFALTILSPAADAASAKEMEKIILLFTDTSIPGERITEVMNEGDAPYKIIHLKIKSGGQKYSAQLFLSEGVQTFSVNVLYEDYTYNVWDNDGDDVVDEAGDGHEPITLDEKLRTVFSAKYRQTVDAMLAYYEANKK